MPLTHSPHSPALFSGARLARRPYCTDDYSAGLKVRPQAQALRHSHVQANSPGMFWRLVFDVDRPGALFAAEDANVAPPSWVAVNPTNGHAHIGYELAEPVTTTDTSRAAPIRFAAAVEHGYTLALKADRGYSGLMCKNPHSSRWHTYVYNPTPYDLPTLAEWLPGLPKTPAKGEASTGAVGRNVALFDALRMWAYRQSGQFTSLDQFNQACRYKAGELNVGGLPAKELDQTARSVSTWVWRRFDQDASNERFSKLQAHRGKLSGKARLAASEDKRASAALMAASGMSTRAIAAELGVNQSTVARWLRG